MILTKVTLITLAIVHLGLVFDIGSFVRDAKINEIFGLWLLFKICGLAFLAYMLGRFHERS